MNTNTTFNTGTFYDSTKMRNMKINDNHPSEREQTQSNLSSHHNMTSKIKNLQTLEEEKLEAVKDKNARIVAQAAKHNEFQHQLNSIIDQVKDIHGKKNYVPRRASTKPRERLI